MTDFDIAVGIDEGTINQALEAIYTSAYPMKPNLFTNAEKIDAIELQIEWDVQQAPSVSLNPPANAGKLISKLHSEDDIKVKALELSMKELDVLAATVSVASFAMRFPKVSVTLKTGDKQPQSVPLSVDLVGRAEVNDNSTVSLVPITAEIKLTKEEPTLQGILDNVLVPILIRQVKSLLGSIYIPQLPIPGIALSAPVVFTEGGCLITLANMISQAPPTVPPPGTPWPKAATFVIAGNNLKSAVVNLGLSQIPIPGNLPNQNYSIDLGVTTFKATAGLRLQTPKVSIKGNNIQFEAEAIGNAGAKFTTFIKDIGVGFKLYAEPNPLVSLVVDVTAHNDIVITFKKVNTFVILAHPDSDPFHWVTGLALTPFVNWLGVTFVPLITTYVRNIRIPVFSLPDIPIHAAGVNINIHPKGLTIGDFNGKTLISGALEVSPCMSK